MNFKSIKESIDTIESELISLLTIIESEGKEPIENDICLLWCCRELYVAKEALEGAKRWINTQEEDKEIV